jgi:NAD(P)-dependent dehydrogenase (short-subunit alcohol dehydrogenase family)
VSVVVVTGAGQGQGAAEARLLAARGTTVIAADLAGALLAVQAIAPLMTAGGRRRHDRHGGVKSISDAVRA